jgi:tetratricopeptide (TPR) repeat protein
MWKATPVTATSYNSIGNVYQNMGEYSKALEYYEKS